MQLPETRPDSPATSRESAKGAKLAVLAPVLDHLAVVRQAARIDELDLAAQLGDVADRGNERFGKAGGALGDLAHERHPVVTGLALDDPSCTAHFPVPAHDLGYLP